MLVDANLSILQYKLTPHSDFNVIPIFMIFGTFLESNTIANKRTPLVIWISQPQHIPLIIAAVC